MKEVRIALNILADVSTVSDWPMIHEQAQKALSELEAQPSVEQRVEAFDRAVANELPCVSHTEYDSHEICKHFASKVRARLTNLLSKP